MTEEEVLRKTQEYIDETNCPIKDPYQLIRITANSVTGRQPNDKNREVTNDFYDWYVVNILKMKKCVLTKEEIYQKICEHIMERKIDYQKFVEKSVEWLCKYIKDNILKSMVIGISGGIDSTVSAFISHKACVKCGIPLIGRSLPTLTNKDSETDAAVMVGKALCDNFKEVEIDSMYNSVLSDITAYEGELTPLQKGNIKARLRMIYLYNLASIHRGVVLDNDNQSEWLLGFWTIHGDSPCDLNIGLHHLYKTEVYELANYLLSTTEEGSPEYLALQKSISLTPTDGNGVSKSDCEQFGLDNYAQVDDVLRVLYNEEKSVDKDEYTRLLRELPEHGMSKVIKLHEQTEYKRKPSPITPSKEEVIYAIH